MRKCVTVVFEINDQDVFQVEEFMRLKQKMLVSDAEPWRVTAISMDDEMTRLDILEEASTMDDGQWLMADIFSATDIANKSIDDFVS